jgi:hypothetical protein
MSGKTSVMTTSEMAVMTNNRRQVIIGYFRFTILDGRRKRLEKSETLEITFLPGCKYGCILRPVSGKFTALDIFELYERSCRNRFKCTHNISGSASTRENFTPFLNLLHFSQLENKKRERA